MTTPARLSHRAVEQQLRSLVRDRPGTVYGVQVTRTAAGYSVGGGPAAGLLVAMDRLAAAAGLRAVDAEGWRDDDDEDGATPSYGYRRL
jgi:hypothetical protein